jgi:Fe2+ or Zn2+ uptake regulation protein
MIHENHFSELLRSKGLKATSGRLLILETLAKNQEPLSVVSLHKLVKRAVDQVTVYRTLEALVASGLVGTVDLRHGHAHYELAVGRKHHHHIICQSCGEIEDVDECDISPFVKKVQKDSKKFGAISEHSLEFFGICKTCSK